MTRVSGFKFLPTDVVAEINADKSGFESEPNGVGTQMATISALAGICEQGTVKEFGEERLEDAVSFLFKPGTWWTKPVNGSLGEKVMRITSHGKKTVVLSRRPSATPVHYVMTKDTLKNALAKTYCGQRFMVQENLGSMRMGDVNF